MPDLTAASILETHEAVWDMPTLAEKHPEIIDWLSARYEVHFGIVSDVIILDKATGKITGHETTDVREALSATLRALATTTA